MRGRGKTQKKGVSEAVELRKLWGRFVYRNLFKMVTTVASEDPRHSVYFVVGGQALVSAMFSHLFMLTERARTDWGNPV